MNQVLFPDTRSPEEFTREQLEDLIQEGIARIQTGCGALHTVATSKDTPEAFRSFVLASERELNRVGQKLKKLL
jgi:hypothetical protein